MFGSLGSIGAGGAALRADKSTYLATVSADALITTIMDPFGSGADFSVVGAAPATLALASGGRIVAGAGAQTLGQTSTIVVRASKGQRAIEGPISLTAVAAPAPTPTPTPTPTPGIDAFLIAAQRIAAQAASKKTFTVADPSEYSIAITTGASAIGGRPSTGAGQVLTSAVSAGYSAPLSSGTRWINTKTPIDQTAVRQTFACGMSNMLPLVNASRIEYGAVPAQSGKSTSMRWSFDGGQSWRVGPQVIATDRSWVCLTLAGGPYPNVLFEHIGEDEFPAISGYNFDPGTFAGAWSGDTSIPRLMMLGDSYVESQGSGPDAGSGYHKASDGMARKMAERVGGGQVYPHGFRTNGFSQTQNGVQSRFADRIRLPTDLSLSEGRHWGTLDAIITPPSINDASGFWDSSRYADAVQYWQNLRLEQPGALVVHVIGMMPPDLTENAPWIADMLAAFRFVFGATAAEQTANGARLIDRSRASGNSLIPAGATGSSPYFPATGDTLHPNPAGHAFAGQVNGDALIALAQDIVALSGGGPAQPTPTSNNALREAGDYALREDGGKIIREGN